MLLLQLKRETQLDSTSGLATIVAHFPGFLFEYAPVKWGGKMKHILIAYFIMNIAVRNQNHNIG